MTTIQQQRQQLTESGYIIVRGMIPPDELQRLRKSVDRMIERYPDSSSSDRLTMTERLRPKPPMSWNSASTSAPSASASD